MATHCVPRCAECKADPPPVLVRKEDTNGVPLPANGNPPCYPLQQISGVDGGIVLFTIREVFSFNLSIIRTKPIIE